MKERNLGIELYRVLLTIFVCVLHVLNQGGVLANSISKNREAYRILEISAYCAVDGYALISGYISNSKKINYKRMIKLWIEVFFYSFIVTLIFRLFNVGKRISLGEIIKFGFPILSNKFWYMTCYFPLIFLSPYINEFINKISIKTAKRILATLVIMFSCFGIVMDNYMGGGYSFAWLLMLYVIGSIMKKIKLFENIKTSSLLFTYIFCVAITWLLMFVTTSTRLVNYISPTILLSAMVLLVVCTRIDIKSNIIPKISSTTTGIYLLQNNEIIWEFIFKNRFIFISNMSILKGLMLVILCAILVFTIGFIVDIFRQLVYSKSELDKVINRTSTIIEERVSLLVNNIYSLIDQI